MAERFTIVSAGKHGSFSCHGTLSREEAVREARRIMQAERDRLEAWLSWLPHEYDVRVVDGLHRERLVRELPAERSGEDD